MRFRQRKKVDVIPRKSEGIIDKVAKKAANTAKKRRKKLGIAPDKRGVEDTFRILSLQYKAIMMELDGYSPYEIAKELDLPRSQVLALIRSGLEEFVEKRDEAAGRKIALQNMRYDRLLKTWQPRALESTKKITDEDGNETEIVVPPDPKAAMVVAKLLKDQTSMHGLNKLRVEHTGKDGGAISYKIDVTALSDEQLEKAAKGDFSFYRAALYGSDPSGSRIGETASAGGEEEEGSSHH